MQFYKVISYIFHPIIFSIVATLLYFILLPSHITKQSEHSILIIVFLSTYIVPLLLLFSMKRFKMIESYHLESIAERKFPVLFMLVLFVFLGRILLLTQAVNLLAYSFFACALGLLFVYVLFFMNIKTSLHTLGVAGLIGFICVISYNYKLNLLLPIMGLFLLFGVVAIARLKLDAHKSKEIYIGFLIGFLSQPFSYYILTSYNI
jgi:hypothetical protein